MMGISLPSESESDATSDQSEVRRLALWALEGKNHSDNPFIGGFTRVEIPKLSNLENQPPKSKHTISPFSMGNNLSGKRDSFGKLLLTSSNSLKDQLHTLLEEEEEEEEEEQESIVRDRQEQGDQQDPEKEALTTVTKEMNETEPQEDTIHVSSFHEDDDNDESLQRFRSPPPMLPLFSNPAPRPRPVNLILRPLSLTPDSLPLSRAVEALPTPSLTPSPRHIGLRTLTLAPSPSLSPSPTPSTDLPRRQTFSASPSYQPFNSDQLRRQSMDNYANSSQLISSISYKRTESPDQQLSTSQLPTPGATPTSTIPPLHVALPSLPDPSSSAPASLPDLDRPLSPTEQAFLFRSHTSLLCRISELESAIALSGTRNKRSRSPSSERRYFDIAHERLGSIASSTSGMSESLESTGSQASDEMLQLVSDLKAERDELMHDADNWRTRVADYERQIAMLNRRVEAERKESWVIRERLGVAEVEKNRVREDLEREKVECRRSEKERNLLRDTVEEEREKRFEAERELAEVQNRLEILYARAERAEFALQSATVVTSKMVSMPLPVRRYNSLDSQMSSSSTDVEEYVPLGMRSRKLNSVDEEDEDEVNYRDLPRDISDAGSKDGKDMDDDDEVDELAHYEDDDGLDLDDDDVVFGDDHTSSSFGSIPRTNMHLLRLEVDSTPAPASLVPASSAQPTHARTGSIERGWTFTQAQSVTPVVKEPSTVDRFFECLDALDENDDDKVLPGDGVYDSRQSWSGAMAMQDDEEDSLLPFLLPAGAGPVGWKDVIAARLEVVAEEEEEGEEEEIPFCPSTPSRGPISMLNVPSDVCARDASLTVSSSPMTPNTMKIALDVKSPAPLPRIVPHRSFTTSLETATGPSGISTSSQLHAAHFAESPIVTPMASVKPRLYGSSTSNEVSPSTSRTSIPSSGSTNLSVSRIPTPCKKRGSNIDRAPTATAMQHSFIPQPVKTATKVARSSFPSPPSPARVLTRVPVPSQTVSHVVYSSEKATMQSSLCSSEPRVVVSSQNEAAQRGVSAQGITAKLSRLWSSSPWNSGSSTTFSNSIITAPVRAYVSREVQLGRLRAQLDEGEFGGLCVDGCARCFKPGEGLIVI